MPINVSLVEMPNLLSKVEMSNSEFLRSEYLRISRDVAESSWIARSPLGYSILSHSDISAIMRDRRWHSALGLMADLNPYTSDDFKRRRKTSIIAIDGDQHMRLKKFLTPHFTPSIADDLRPFMRETLTELIDKVSPLGRADIAQDIARHYPVRIISQILGIPQYDIDDFSRWAVDMLSNFDLDFMSSTDSILKSQNEMDEYVESIIEMRRADPQNDLISLLVHSELDGERLTVEEILTLVEALMIAGIDTTQNQISTCVSILLDNQFAWNTLKTRPSSAKLIVEELMRINGSVAQSARIASEDIEYRGILFPKGTILFINLAAGNYDEATFDNPDEFIPNRRELESMHMSFGMGLHYCLGAPLARAEIQEALVMMAEKFKNIKRAGDVLFKKEISAVYGPTSLPVTFDPA